MVSNFGEYPVGRSLRRAILATCHDLTSDELISTSCRTFCIKWLMTVTRCAKNMKKSMTRLFDLFSGFGPWQLTSTLSKTSSHDCYQHFRNKAIRPKCLAWLRHQWFFHRYPCKSPYLITVLGAENLSNWNSLPYFALLPPKDHLVLPPIHQCSPNTCNEIRW